MKTLLSIVLSLLLSAGAFAQLSTSKWQSKPIMIDGDGSDWESIPRFFNTDSNVKYEFRNDDKNLYLILKSTSRATQLQLLQAGFSIRLKVKTQPVIKLGITFPPKKIKKMVQMLPKPEESTGGLVEKSEYKAFNDTAVLDGFQVTNGIITSEIKDVDGICFAKSKNMRDGVSYEFQIPIKEIFGKNFAMADISKIPMQLQVNINEMSQSAMKEIRSGRGMRGGGMRGGGGMQGGRNGGDEMGMPENGEMGGGMNGGGMENREGMSEGNMSENSMGHKSFNIDFKLSEEIINK
jgi:hypothetical protein